MAPWIKDLLSYLPHVTAFAAIIVSVKALSQQRRAMLTTAYFEQLVSAYSNYLAAVSHHFLTDSPTATDELTKCYLRVQLFATAEVNTLVDDVHLALLECHEMKASSALHIDEKLALLGEAMRKDLKKFDAKRKR